MTETLTTGGSVSVDPETSEGVLHVVLNRPKKRNAFDLDMVRSLTRTIDGRPAGTRVVVLSGGSFFCAGADISVYGSRDLGEIGELTRSAGVLIETIAAVPVPVIAAVEGMALGGGFEVALAADLVVAGETAKLGLPEVSLGLIPGWGGTQRLAAQVGGRKAKQLIMFQQRLKAAEAHELGLVNEVVAAGTSLERALEWAAVLADSSASALAATKELVSGAERALAYSDERATLMELFTSADGVEGVEAFVQKRPADFRR
ncbi:enoyl-CoA hydratase/isomerase family protein [Mycolicibacterium nivoides]|uniref:enoyl-CoA hydratase/isomerase family protein n=1 Tax=Mycolicibacterium nivoides TaxID=2487344 RepID=UPI0008D496C2|nr:enoyl-CoA hydratase/isomerase family protein [Mycolicibacterium nivoides]SEP59429.1 Enoyl-CoA hydratase/carnithine racemase [Mycobacterium sp. 88mf]SFF04489.1 Enoyl-CoA hydratase/carnithine racemase [Mycobacterium sp. 455mf]